MEVQITYVCKWCSQLSPKDQQPHPLPCAMYHQHLLFQPLLVSANAKSNILLNLKKEDIQCEKYLPNHTRIGNKSDNLFKTVLSQHRHQYSCLQKKVAEN